MWRARDPDLGVDRAVKLLDDSPGDDGVERRERLRREARAMASLGHPHVLQVLDIGEHDGRPFVVMPLAERGSLSDRVRDEGPLSVVEATRLLEQVLSAAAAAHAAGIVHRDIKPQNILLDADGDALLADFGIARLEAEDGDRSTRTGMALGSLAYMAPEQRLDASRVGPTADLYAVGATAYHLLTGLSPMDLFVAGPEDARWAGIPPGLRAELVRATRYAPEERHADAAALSAALRAAAGTAAPTAVEKTAAIRPPEAPGSGPSPTLAVATPPPPASPQTRRPRTLMLPLLVILGFSVSLAGAVLWLRSGRLALEDGAAPPDAGGAAMSPGRGEAPEPGPPGGSAAGAPAGTEPEGDATPVLADAGPRPAPPGTLATAPEPPPRRVEAPPPVAEAPPEAAPDAAAPSELAPILHAWQGNLGGANASLRLRPGAGPEDAGAWPVSGTLSVTRNQKSLDNPARGEWHPAERRLSLRVASASGISTLELVLEEPGRLGGSMGRAGSDGRTAVSFFR